MSPKCPYCGQNATITEQGGLTDRQAELLNWLIAWDWSGKKSPTYSEIAVGINYASKSSIHRVLRALEERGFVRCKRRRARGIVLMTATGGQNGTPAQGPTAETNVEAVVPAPDQER